MADRALGIFVDDDGTIWACVANEFVNGRPLVVRRLGAPSDAARQSADVLKLSFGQALKRYPSALVCSRVIDYPDRAALSENESWMPATCGLALQHVALCLPQELSALILAVRQSLRGLEASLVDSTDGVFEVLATRFEHYDLEKTLEQQLGALIVRTCLEAGYRSLHRVGSELHVVVAADDQSILQTVRDVVCNVTEQPSNAFTLAVKDHAAAAAGAACRAGMRRGMLPWLISLDTAGFDLDVTFGAHRFRLVHADDTIPHAHTELLELDAGEVVTLELFAADEPQRFTAIDMSPLIDVKQVRRLVELSVDIDAHGRVIVSWVCPGESWGSSAPLAELVRNARQGRQPSSDKPPLPQIPIASPNLEDLSQDPVAAQAPVAAQDPAAAQDPDATSFTKASAKDIFSKAPAHLMRLIEALDEVDLGVRALSDAEIATPAGQSIVTVQARLLAAIEDLGATYYPAIGEHFDPTIHEAMGVVNNPDLPPDSVADELRRGYTYEGRVIRYSLVMVANPR